MSKQHTLSELAELLNGSLHGDGDRTIESLASISNAAAADLTYLDNRKFEEELKTTLTQRFYYKKQLRLNHKLKI